MSRPKRACTTTSSSTTTTTASSTSISYGSVVWADFGPDDEPWPAILVNPAFPNYLPTAVAKLVEESDMTREYLVWSMGSTGYFLSRRIRLFDPTMADMKTVSAAMQYDITEATRIQSEVDVLQRIVGRRAIFAHSGLLAPTPAGQPRTPTKLSSSHDSPTTPAAKRIREHQPTSKCPSCSSLYSYPHTILIPPCCPACAMCIFCGGGGEQNNLLLCDTCGQAEHVFCSPLPLDDDAVAKISDETTSHVCAMCLSGRKPELKDLVLFRRVFNVGTMLQEQFLYNGVWYEVNNNELPPASAIAAFYQSPLLQCSLSMSVASGLTAFPHHREIVIGDNQTSQVIDWVLPSGTRLGITQIPNFLSQDELLAAETRLATVITGGGGGEEGSSLIQHFNDKPNTLDASVTTKRLKMFHGFRYSYGGNVVSPTQESLFDDVAPIESQDKDIAIKVEAAIHALFPSLPAWTVNQVVVNVYVDAGASLGVHMDSARLFHRPICSLRLWNNSTLSFGCAGFGGTETASFLGIPLARGTLTIMHGFAADRLKHCIQSKHVRGLTASVLFRQVKVEGNLNVVTIPAAALGTEKITDAIGPATEPPKTQIKNKVKEIEKCVEMFNKSYGEWRLSTITEQ